MAGRKPRDPRDALAGVTPLHGRPPPRRRSPGAHAKDAVYPAPEAIEPRARRFLRDVLADPGYPDHIRSPAFAQAAFAWAKAEVVAEMVFRWMSEQMERGGIGAMMLPPMPGTRPLVETVGSVEARAERARARLGLDPVSYAKIMSDLGLSRRAEDEALEGLGKRGAEITARRAEIEGPDGAPPA